jgi:hypothetical protein
MSEYNPDVWVIVEIAGTKVDDSPYHRVLAGWYGGYAGADVWKMNSGITHIIEHNDYYSIYGTTGSVYQCPKQLERFSMYTSSIFANFAAQNCEEMSITHVKMGDIISRYLTTKLAGSLK